MKHWNGVQVALEREDEGGGGGGMSALFQTQSHMGVPISSPLSDAAQQGGAEGQQEDENGSQGHQRSSQGHQGDQGQGQQKPGPVPYDRFKQVNDKLGEREQTISQLQAMVAALSGERPGAKKGAASEEDDEAEKDKNAKFYRDPRRYTDQAIAQAREELAGQYAALQEAVSYEHDKRALRSLHGANSEVEQAVVAVIQQHGLKKLGATSALRVAYKYVTGKELGDAAPSQQHNRQVVRNGQRPGSGGADQGAITREEFAKLPLSKFAEDPQGYAKRIYAALTQQPS